MHRKSYLQRQIEGLGVVLAQLLGLKQTGDNQSALMAIRAAAKALTGMSGDQMALLPAGTLLSVFSPGGEIDAGSCLVAGVLLDEEAALFRLSGHTEQAAALTRKSAVLLAEAITADPLLCVGNDYRERLDALVARIGEPSLDLRRRLARMFESLGEFGHAEDQHFALRDAGVPDAGRDAVAFYRRLLALPDALLDRGGLPRDEIEEELTRLEGKQTTP